MGVGEELPEFRRRKRANADFIPSVVAPFRWSDPRSNKKQIPEPQKRILEILKLLPKLHEDESYALDKLLECTTLLN